jgi:transcriptional regulator with XRE-family HTH domain
MVHMSQGPYAGKAFTILISRLFARARSKISRQEVALSLGITRSAIANICIGSSALALNNFAPTMRLLRVSDHMLPMLLIMAGHAYGSNANWSGFMTAMDGLSSTFPEWEKRRQELPALIEKIESGDRRVLAGVVEEVQDLKE